MPEREYQCDILLSHVSRDTAWCEQLAKHLCNNGERVYHANVFMALADVIFTAEESLNRSVDNFPTARKLMSELMRWLSLVREHLLKNLSMDKVDCDLTRLLEMRDATAKARKVFGSLVIATHHENSNTCPDSLHHFV